MACLRVRVRVMVGLLEVLEADPEESVLHVPHLGLG